ncbi:hypothetical protein BDA99DRAFT_181726 [Phascolomyces articulosus]|uniref:non-specific serine/threonine protein kinase n=1 Tax=Phascolomyces articulosus TaxID=60185 RepID=A0AAD5PAA6_9FUNG|nr:hypothetical protein BDA99DRAFT_181726 [Phascolomyces articulosus]
MSTSTNNAMCQVPPPTSTTDSLLRTRSLPRSFNTDSIHNENKADQSARPPRGHRRQQASIGLGIITTNLDISSTTTTNNNNNNENNNEKKKQESSVQEMKNDAFFNTSSIPLPRPPPALRSNASPQPPPPSSSQPITTTSTTTQNTERTSMELDEEDIGNRRISLASRLRTLVAANKSGTTPAPSPIPNNYMHKDNTNKSNLAVTGGGTTPRSYSDDEIMPLPSPAPGSSSPSSSHYPAPHHSSSSSSLSSQQQQQLYHHHPHKPHHLFPKHRIVSPPQLSPVTPDADENDSPPSPSASTSIPVIAVSPSLTPERKNKLPSLREEPMLGDIDDKAYHEAILAANNNTLHDNHSNNTTMIPTGGLVVPMMREYKFPSPSPLRYNEEDIVGKQIWDYQIGKLLGVGAFSKVYIANHLSTGQDYAIKMVNKERIAKDARVRSSIEREVGVLRVC